MSRSDSTRAATLLDGRFGEEGFACSPMRKRRSWEKRGLARAVIEEGTAGGLSRRLRYWRANLSMGRGWQVRLAWRPRPNRGGYGSIFWPVYVRLSLVESYKMFVVS